MYQQLIDKLNQFPSGAPKTEQFVELLKSLFTEDEAKLGAELPIFPTPLATICDSLGRKETEVKPLLESMANKGLVYHRKQESTDLYSLFPLVPGIFELQFMKGEVNPKTKRLAELFDKMWHSGWAEDLFASRTQMARIVVMEKEIPSGVEVFPYERVSKFIDEADYLALSVCYCRHEQELLGKSCGRPKDVCLQFGPFARYVVERGFGRKITKEEAHKVLAVSEEAGLVHLSDNTQKHINFICNCCGCCCGILGGITRLHKPHSVATSHFVLEIDADTCSACGACVDRCHFGALTVNEVAEVDPDKCLGCGLCNMVCPTESLKMRRREEILEPKRNFRELMGAIMQEKGKL
ncbi:MAG: 4Fe-4S dicluster domain-containing protein [Candidatus Abyssobacteria bacterium SURF_17]|uniref:4Fe-4S dicluster domain-containing protein n=1 Tax=Candidatus Abyssobacteria bacterium SURF_17 TaxID=2093361 RepID=A0A419EZG2_9BACT|nr:MAG: 4Fe-4S dicluster domain-containing protein [Candidatus Abyssubacteria bacterium SURF_17]